MTSDEYKERLARAHDEFMALAEEHVDPAKGMGQDTPLVELDALRAAALGLWDENERLAEWAIVYKGLPVEEIVRSVWSMGVLTGWRAALLENDR